MNITTPIAATAVALLIVSAGIAAAKPVKIFILSGQSNMTGRGGLGDLKKPAADQKATLARFIMAPDNAEIHWHANGESDWLMGDAMGREMVKLLGPKN